MEFRILGPLEVADGGGMTLPLGGQRQRAVLALLLLRVGEVVSTERLIDELWGERPPRTATTSLHNAISQLRKLLGPDRLVTRPPGYELHVGPAEIDLAQFEQLRLEARGAPAEERARKLREGLALWRGPALADFTFAPFAQNEIQRLEELRFSALEDRIEADLELGFDSGLVGELEALVGANPLRERPRGQLMLALYRSGRQAEALQAYHEGRRALVGELGIEPGPALRELHAAILRQERSLRLAGDVERSPDDHYADVLQAILGARLVPVLGPEASLCGRDPEAAWQKTLAAVPPADADVATHLAEAFGYPPELVTALSRVSQFVAVTRGLGPLQDELHDVYAQDYPPGPVHRLLAALPPFLRARGLPCQLIVTTTYDVMLERAFADADEQFDVVAYIGSGRNRGRFLHIASDGSTRVIEEPNVEAGLTTEERTVILKLHGSVDRGPERERESFVVSEDDYIDYLAHAELLSVIPVGLAAKLRRSHFLFLGYGVDEWNLRVFLRRLWGDERLSYRSWAVHPDTDGVATEYWRQRGVELFDVLLEEYCAELGRRVEDAVAGEVPA